MDAYKAAPTPDTRLYDRIARNAENACTALSQLMPITPDSAMKAEMAVQRKKYRQFQAAAQRALESMGSQASTPGVVGRLCMDMGVQLKARTDPSNRHLAQMLAQGCCLGVTGCVMARRDNAAASENAQRLARELEQFEQNAADRWRDFL